jgi:Leu/Phe-tRNA-protein transferase
MVFRLPAGELVFPNPELADPDGFLAVGGDLSPERLLLAYRNGIFPWLVRMIRSVGIPLMNDALFILTMLLLVKA